MEKKLEIISNNLLQEIRKYLKDNDLFNQNFKVELVIGRYSIWYEREYDKKLSYVVDIPDELYKILKKHIIEIDTLWIEEGEEQEWEENRFNAEHKVDIIIDGFENELNDVSEIQALLIGLKKRLAESIQNEEFEEAVRYRDKINKYEIKIENSKKM